MIPNHSVQNNAQKVTIGVQTDMNALKMAYKMMVDARSHLSKQILRPRFRPLAFGTWAVWITGHVGQKG